MEAANPFKTPVPIHQTARSHTPEDRILGSTDSLLDPNAVVPKHGHRLLSNITSYT
jgi:hypothetical protein